MMVSTLLHYVVEGHKNWLLTELTGYKGIAFCEDKIESCIVYERVSLRTIKVLRGSFQRELENFVRKQTNIADTNNCVNNY